MESIQACRGREGRRRTCGSGLLLESEKRVCVLKEEVKDASLLAPS